MLHNAFDTKKKEKKKRVLIKPFLGGQKLHLAAITHLFLKYIVVKLNRL